MPRINMVALASLFAFVGTLFAILLVTNVTEAGGCCEALSVEIVMPQQVSVEQKFDVKIVLTNTFSRSIRFSGIVFVEGAAATPHDGDPVVSTGEAIRIPELDGWRYYWSGGIVFGGQKATFTLPMTAKKVGKYDFARARLIATIPQEVVTTQKTLAVTEPISPTPTATPSPTPTPAPKPVIFSLPNLTAEVGKYVTVPVSVSGGSPVVYVGVLVKYDKTRLQLSGLPSGKDCNLERWDQHTGWNTTDGFVWFSLRSSKPVVVKCTLNVSFSVIGEGNAPMEFVTTLDRNGHSTTALNGDWPDYKPVPFTTTNGQVVAKAGPKQVITAKLTTSSSSWPTGSNKTSRWGDFRVEIKSTIASKFYYRIRGTCPIYAVQPGFGYWTERTDSFVMGHTAYLTERGGSCNITLSGQDLAGNQIPPQTITVNVAVKK